MKCTHLIFLPLMVISVLYYRPVAPRASELLRMLDENSRVANTQTARGQVVGGTLAPQGVWPATFAFMAGSKGCTSTAIGRQVLLTAAHCVGENQRGEVVVQGQVVSSICNLHPAYRTFVSAEADFALCKLNSRLPTLGEGFERVGVSYESTQKGKELLLLGYGCITDRGRTDYRNLYQGFAPIAENRSAKGFDYSLTDGKVWGCGGDSGGGVYSLKSKTSIAGERMLVGIMRDIEDKLVNGAKITYLSNTSTIEFLIWARCWAEKRRLTICGVWGPEDNCRSADGLQASSVTERVDCPD